MELYYKQAVDISVEIQEIFERMFVISSESQEEELKELTGQLKNSVKKVISVFCDKLGDNLPELKMLFVRLYGIVEREVVKKELFEELIHKINVMCITEILKEEEDFSSYIDGLQMACKCGFSILLAVCDTPCGSPDFSYAMGEKLRQLGLNVNLSTKYRASYCALIDGKMNLEEKISEISPLTIHCKLNGAEIDIKSRGFNKIGTEDIYVVQAGASSISINGKQVTVKKRGVCTRGISFVVYDKFEGCVLDSVNFDTLCENIPAYRNKDSRLVREYIERHPEVVFLKQKGPVYPSENLSENEKNIFENRINMYTLTQNPNLPCVLSEYIGEPEGIVEVVRAPRSYIGTDGTRHIEEYHGKYLNVVNGHRLTVGQPEKYKRVVYFVGGCDVLGIGNRDEGTEASQLQKLLNEYAEEEGFIVENYGHALDGMSIEHEMISMLESLPLRPGDIVIGLGGTEVYNPELDIRPYKYGELFWDEGHLTETATMLIAKGLFNNLKENDFYREYLQYEQKVYKKSGSDYGLNNEQLSELNHYKKALSAFREEKLRQFNCIGSIVMNCNPFTRGHRYLIEESAKRCDCLIVFVVQEDKSFFPFSDRFELVKKGCADLKNVFVMESGKFIISSLTFEDYFNKKSLQDRVIDCSDDVTLFVNEIAPALGIQVRFVGSEPHDKVTNQYNRTLERMLPLYGIEFVEITRKEKEGEAISASKVRELLKDYQWEAISGLVPDVTLKYLKSKYGETA